MMPYASSRVTEWWPDDLKGRDRAVAMTSSARATERNTIGGRGRQILAASAMYGTNNGIAGAMTEQSGLPLRKNAFASACDTWTSHIAQSVPRPMWSTVGGDWDARERARFLLQWWDALVERCGLRAKLPMMIRDSGLFDLGPLRPYRPGPGQPISFERIHPINIVMDDSLTSELPREIYVRRFVARSALAASYRDHEDAISRAPRAAFTTWFLRGSLLDAVEVWEGWHLPAFAPENDNEPTDGRHMIAIGNASLVDEEWRAPRWPGAMMRALPPTAGYYGLSYYGRAASPQQELNRVLRIEQEGQHTHAITKLLMHEGSTLRTQALSDAIGETWSFTGQPPIPLQVPPMHELSYQRMAAYEAAVFEAWGVSQLAASQIKPAGLDSKPALRAYADFQDRRHVFTLLELAQAVIDLARACVDLERAEAKRLQKDGQKHTVPCGGEDEGYSDMPWPDIDLEDRKAALRISPTGILGGSPSDQLETLNDMRDRGVIDDQQYFAMLPSPDLRAARSRATAPRDWIEKRLDTIAKTGRYLGPEPYMNLALAMPLAVQRVCLAENRGEPRARVDLLKRWVIDCAAMIGRLRGNPDEALQMGVTPDMLPPPPPGTQPTAPGAPPPPPMQAPGAAPQDMPMPQMAMPTAMPTQTLQ